ncbi:MAG: hypothetical protein A3E84_03355 [Gammaproteobacteria bacterium RIFCSPHIGHO2_12_FULL_42_13]|nr:MAG: hypothetical protein A3E84_03355 [Gammaproteobacteria bacterium RIFCSPHIGHO2_12_FULL_42_13]
MKKGLPIGVSTLEKIVENNYLYIDKTAFIEKLAQGGGYYFLSRPRRFGKSLFLDTLKQAFLGNKDLFKGLYLETHWNWDKKRPVIHFDFGSTSAYDNENTLTEAIWNVLRLSAQQYDIHLENLTISIAFHELIRKISEKTNSQVVILVDEYDKPILDVITDEPQALIMREILKGLYSVIKANDAYLRFVFLTGVTKFSKVGLFSGLNNLNEITLHSDYADICGYTQTELEKEFHEYLIDNNVDKIKLKLWYNGYNFAGSETQKVYNPFDILLFLSSYGEYKSYWFETGSPSFLIKLIQQNKYYFPEMENTELLETSLSSFDVNQIELTSLLFQTGYLTIKEKITMGAMLGYVLGYPNLEVKASLNDRLLTIGTTGEIKNAVFRKLLNCIQSSDLSQLSVVFQSHFASIPHDWYRNNDMQRYEGFYASIVYSYFCALGYTVIAEDNTNTGQLDLTVILPDKVLILEFKLSKNGDAASALQQIKDKRYADKYQSEQKPIYLLGMSFDADTRNMQGFVWSVV